MSRQSILIYFMCLFVRFSFTKLHLLMRLRWGPSPASCSVSGIHLPACRHASTPGIKEREKTLKLQLIMLTWKSVTRQLRTEGDKAHVCFITTSWKISSIGKAAVVDRERCPQHDGVNDATLVLSISSLSRIRASSLSFRLLRFYRVKLRLCDSQHPGIFWVRKESFVLSP